MGLLEDLVGAPVGEGAYAIDLSDDWSFYAPSGGFLTSVALSAATRTLDEPAQALVSSTTQFLAPVRAGPATVEVRVLRRGGAASQVEQLALSDVATIAFVSCNPVTFARDAEVLIGAGYKIGAVRVIDQFRWSPHVELATTFRR